MTAGSGPRGRTPRSTRRARGERIPAEAGQGGVCGDELGSCPLANATASSARPPPRATRSRGERLPPCGPIRERPHGLCALGIKASEVGTRDTNAGTGGADVLALAFRRSRTTHRCESLSREVPFWHTGAARALAAGARCARGWRVLGNRARSVSGVIHFRCTQPSSLARLLRALAHALRPKTTRWPFCHRPLLKDIRETAILRQVHFQTVCASSNFALSASRVRASDPASMRAGSAHLVPHLPRLQARLHRHFARCGCVGSVHRFFDREEIGWSLRTLRSSSSARVTPAQPPGQELSAKLRTRVIKLQWPFGTVMLASGCAENPFSPLS